MKYVCIDPGKLTGLALLSSENGEQPIIEEALELSQFEACAWIKEQLEVHSGNVKVICEDFIISERTAKKSTKDTRFSLEIIGYTRVLCKNAKIPFVLQTPATMKTFFGDWSLRDFNLWSKGGEGHKRDSLRHGTYFLLVSGIWNPPMEHTSKGDYATLRKNYAID